MACLSGLGIHPNLIRVFLADAEVIAGYLYSHRIAQGSYHFYPYRFAGDAAHFHQCQLEIAFLMAFDDSLFAGRQLGKAQQFLLRYPHRWKN